MKIQPINNTNFKALYIEDGEYTEEQQRSIQRIRELNINKLEERGYDVLIKNYNSYSGDMEVFLAPRGFKSNRREIGCHYMDFNPEDLCEKIDKENQKLARLKNTGWAIIGTVYFLLMGSIALSGIKGCSNKSASQKITTELLQSSSHIK